MIQQNPGLVSLAGPALDEVPGDLVIVDNLSLTSLEGLEGIRTVGGRVTVGSVYALHGALGGSPSCRNEVGITSLAGLRGLSAVGALEVQCNSVLSGLEGLDGLTEIDGDVEIFRLSALGSLVGLDQLSRVGALRIGSAESPGGSNDVLP